MPSLNHCYDVMLHNDNEHLKAPGPWKWNGKTNSFKVGYMSQCYDSDISYFANHAIITWKEFILNT